MSPILSDRELAEAEQFTKPGTANVSPSDLKKLAPLMRHYAKSPHPFSACKRDQMRHGLSEGHANRRCAVLKDLIRGTTKWRGKEAEEAWAAVEEAEDRLEAIAEVIGEEGVQALISEAALSSSARKELPASAFVFSKERRYPIHDLSHARNALARSSGKPEEATVRAAVHKRYPQLKKDSQKKRTEALAELVAEVEDCSTILEFVGPAVEQAFKPPRWAVPPGSKSVTSKGTRAGGPDDPEFEKKHPRAQEGSPTGGQFVRKGGKGAAVKGVQKKLGLKSSGTFDEQTRRAVVRFQRKEGLTVDGIVGQQTAAALLGNDSASKVKTGSIRKGQRQRLAGGSSDSGGTDAPSRPKPISAPSEDSLSKAKTDRLAKRGWDYHDGKWWPPGHRQNKKPSRGREAEDPAEGWEPGLLHEEVVDVEVRTRDDGTKTATYDRVRSALFDLSRRDSKTDEVRLPHGVSVTAKELAPDRFGIRKTEYTVKHPNGRRVKCSSATEAAEYAKDWDAALGGASLAAMMSPSAT